MASGGNVVIRLVTNYVGKGIDLLNSAMTTTGRLIARTVQGITSALGNLASVAGKQIGGLISEFGNLGKMIAQGGVWGAAQFGVTKLIDYVSEKINAAKETAKEAAKSVAESFTTGLSAIEKKFKAVADAISLAASRAKSIAAAKGKESDFINVSDLVDIDIETRHKLQLEFEESERAIIQANAKLEKAKVEAEAQVRKASAAAEAADDDVRRAEERLAAANDALTAATKQRAMLMASYFSIKGNEDEDAENRKIIWAAVKKADEAIRAAAARVEAETVAFKNAGDAARGAMADVNNARLQAWNSVEQAEFDYTEAVRKQTEEAEKRAKAESLAAQKAEVNAQMREALSKTSDSAEQAVIKARAKLEQALLDAAEDEKDTKAKEAVDTARFELAEAIKNQEKEERKNEAKGLLDAEREKQRQEAERHNQQIEKLLKEIADIEKEREKTIKGMAVDAQNKGWNPYQYHFDKDGKISFSDWQRTRRYGDETNDEAKARRRREQEDKRMEDLEKKWMSGQKLSDREQKKLRDWWDFQEEVNGKDKRQAQIEKLQREAAEAAKKSEQHLKAMKERLDKWIDSGVMN